MQGYDHCAQWHDRGGGISVSVGFGEADEEVALTGGTHSYELSIQVTINPQDYVVSDFYNDSTQDVFVESASLLITLV